MIPALILAAGESRRMGRPKMLLPWGASTVLGRVIATFQEAGLEDVLVVTGGAHEQVAGIVNEHGGRSLFNPQYSSSEMLSSLQCGIRYLLQQEEVEAALIGLGDQPQIQVRIVQLICNTYRERSVPLIVPSYRMRRGHPWLVARSLWDELLDLQAPQSPRDFLNLHAAQILYVPVDSPSVLADLDTPQDYQNYAPNP